MSLFVDIPSMEFWDSSKNEFINTQGCRLQLEHSLVSVAKWESKWHKPFLDKATKSKAESIDYIRCMTINQNVPDSVYRYIPDNVMNDISDYISNPMTATWFSESDKNSLNRDVITAEIIYYSMIAFNIPFECQKWHLNRLLTLIRVCNIKNQPPKQKGKMEILSQNRALNEERKKMLNTKG